MDKFSEMQFLILSDVRSIAYRLFNSFRRKALAARSTAGRFHGPPVGRRLASVVGLMGVAALMIVTPACQHNNPGSGAVWAEVDGIPIYRSQVDKIYDRPGGPASEAQDKEEELTYKLDILNQLINNQILMTYAAHSGITVSESDIDTRIGQLKSPYSQQQFEQKLKSQGITEGDLREEVRTTLTVNKLINRDINSRVSVSDADIQAYYDHNKTSFDVPETEYHLAQIEVTPGSNKDVHNLKNDDAKTPEMAQRKIQALYAQLRAGQDFATVAQNYSEDPNTAMNGGDMGFVPESSIAANADLDHVIKGLKVGQFSGIITSRSGYHIIKLLGVEKAGQHPVTDPQVQGQIRKTLLNEKEQLLKAAYIQNLRDKAKIRNLLAEQIVKDAQ
jgi:peptidyl-prolyl cis-trans isomerase SurA